MSANETRPNAATAVGRGRLLYLAGRGDNEARKALDDHASDNNDGGGEGDDAA